MQVTESGKGKTIEAFGLQTNYLEMGQGEPLLLLHGSGPAYQHTQTGVKSCLNLQSTSM